MKQEYKELLLKDLVCRLPYGVKIHKALYGATTLSERDIESFRKGVDDILMPYLRPMSSMTDEEKIDFQSFFNYDGIEYPEEYIDWLNAHHFDYRGLIPKGLAIEVTKDNNPYKN